MFTFFFYWDTYFINCGLIFDDPAQALNNLRNMKFLVERFGFIPNANAKGMLNRSQPPLYASAVKDYYDRFPSVSVAEEFYPTLKREYEFWISRRSTSCGLARYASEPSEEEISEMYGALSSRGILEPNAPDMRLRTLNLFAEAESGWDFTPRFLGRALDFAPADLNSILFANERILSEFADILGRAEDSAAFARAADAAARVAEKYLTAVSETFAEEGFLCEKYSALTGRCSTHNEYEPPKMLGWTAGVFRELYERYAK